MASSSAPVGFIDIQIIGDDLGVQKMLNHLDTALSPIAIAEFLGARVDPFLRERARARFGGEGDDAVGQWTPLTAATQNIRAQMGFGADHPINVRTGELESYILDSPNDINIHGEGATLKFPGSLPRDPELRSKLETAQAGKVKPDTPARPVLGMNEKDLEFVLTALAFHIKEGSL